MENDLLELANFMNEQKSAGGLTVETSNAILIKNLKHLLSVLLSVPISGN